MKNLGQMMKAVGVVAPRAARLRHREVPVRLGEARRARLVAGEAERLLLLLEQVRRLHRAVGVVAGDAPALLHRAVRHLRARRLLDQRLVAAGAELVPGRHQLELARRSVRVMAARALP